MKFNDWFEDRGWILTVAFLAILAAVVLTLTLIRVTRETRDTVQALEEEIVRLTTPEPAVGGAEVPIPEIVAGPEWRFPIADSDFMMLTSPFGYRISPLLEVEMHHQGLDISAAWRAQVVAVADGMVIEHWPPPSDYWRGHDVYGGMITIEHEGGLRTLYAHLSSTRIHTGNTVRAGQVIGRVGNTGKSDGAHLHIEIFDDAGETLNPLLWIAKP